MKMRKFAVQGVRYFHPWDKLQLDEDFVQGFFVDLKTLIFPVYRTKGYGPKRKTFDFVPFLHAGFLFAGAEEKQRELLHQLETVTAKNNEIRKNVNFSIFEHEEFTSKKNKKNTGINTYVVSKNEENNNNEVVTNSNEVSTVDGRTSNTSFCDFLQELDNKNSCFFFHPYSEDTVSLLKELVEYKRKAHEADIANNLLEGVKRKVLFPVVRISADDVHGSRGEEVRGLLKLLLKDCQRDRIIPVVLVCPGVADRDFADMFGCCVFVGFGCMDECLTLWPDTWIGRGSVSDNVYGYAKVSNWRSIVVLNSMSRDIKDNMKGYQRKRIEKEELYRKYLQYLEGEEL